MSAADNPPDRDDPDFDDLVRVDQRLTDLEVKAAFSEDLLDHLNQTIIAQQRQIDLLIREVTQLRQQVGDAQPATFRSLRDELPPHY